MKRAIFVPVAALAALTACNDDPTLSGEPATGTPEANEIEQTPKQADRAEQEPAQGDEPGFNKEMAYYFSRGERGPSLSYGVPRTDNIALTLRCPTGGSGKTVLVYFNRPAQIVAQRPDTITLSAGDARQELPVETRKTQLGTTVEIQTRLDSAPIEAFRAGMPLEVAYGEETIAIPSRSSDEEIEKFFSACMA